MPAFNKPPIDIIEENDSYLIVIDLPGVKPENIEVKGYDTYIEISGFREPLYGRNYLLMERFSGRFKRRIEFKRPVNISDATATFKDGVLFIKVPKSQGNIVFNATTIIIRR